jgi:hypothetical protein
MTQFETLPNELIYLIFKYLNANDILIALSNLNSRFTALLAAYTDYKLDFRSVSKDVYDFVCSQIIPSYVQMLYLSNNRYTYGQIQNFFNRFSLSSFSSRLRSLSLKSCLENGSKEIIDQLHLLTKLTVFSFVANAGAEISFDLRRQLVQAIAQLPSLRRCTIKIYNDELIFDIFGLVFQPLEHLCLGISSLDQLVHLCRRAPNLKYLVIDAVIDEPFNIDDCSSLANLTHLSMRTAANMEELERLLTKARSLVSLSLVCSNFECHDGNRWQQILSKIKLSKFRFLFFKDPSPAMDSSIDPFREKFWSERGWYIRYEQQKTNGYINLYTIPYPSSLFLLCLANTSTVATTKMVDAIEVFDSVRELVYIGCETEISSNNNYFFPHIETLVLENDALPPSRLVSFEHIKKLRLHTPLTQYIFNDVSMPALTRLILQVLPATWTVSYLNRRLRYLKLRTTESLTDEEVEAMCASTSFAIHCKHIGLPIRSRQSVRLLLNQLTYLESVDFIFRKTVPMVDLAITEDWIRNETCLRNFLLTTDIANERLCLWISRSNYLI